ncbi:MAG: hypothetical protein CL537_13115 [Alcanivoracaceae bacterium]|uniref:hypothetical protein n=1 Tax=Alcanivorax sp. MD8A TaxID=1177157 RepID=UPI000C3D8F02|nr:hypothetical protein [Alcanivorax sp. MD8A]MAX56426.1 hypothetical protein [Alcanivoracaceae bacterium]MCG8439472.1 hypothetical protein [Pseudomonadales bacterium]MEE2869641.1 hypothetical protein [Pseudomonadota bacterium]PNE01258.1 hypothetical protein A15D_03153 [Alcanivorax sp. MD8A]
METLQIDVTTLGWLLFAAAVASSLLTLLVLGLVGHFILGPRIERKIDRRLEEGADRLEERLRKRFVDLLTGRSREVIRDRAMDLARGVGLIGGRRPNRDDDDEPQR